MVNWWQKHYTGYTMDIGPIDYIDKLKAIDSNNSFVVSNYEAYKNRAENGSGIMNFLKSIFGKRMG